MDKRIASNSIIYFRSDRYQSTNQRFIFPIVAKHTSRKTKLRKGICLETDKRKFAWNITTLIDV